MKKYQGLMCFLSVLVLAACGGGSSSSGGGDNQYAGTYSGNHTVTFRANGTSSTGEIFLTLTVNGDGSYRFVDGDGGASSVTADGTLDGNRFRATGTGNDSIDGVSCDVTATYSGTVDDDSAMGTSEGNGRCSGSGSTVNITFSGDFDLPKGGNSKSRSNSSIISNISSLLE